jgi:hypothetical protein
MSAPESNQEIAAKRVAKRFSFCAKVTIHKNGRSVKGKSLNISRSGIFVSTTDSVFAVNEKVSLHIKPKPNSQGYDVLAIVKRFGDGRLSPQGYGLEFVKNWPR